MAISFARGDESPWDGPSTGGNAAPARRVVGECPRCHRRMYEDTRVVRVVLCRRWQGTGNAAECVPVFGWVCCPTPQEREVA